MSEHSNAITRQLNQNIIGNIIVSNMAKKKLEPPKKIVCLYHTQTMCICIKPVTSIVELEKKIESHRKRKELLARFGIEDKWS